MRDSPGNSVTVSAALVGVLFACSSQDVDAPEGTAAWSVCVCVCVCVCVYTCVCGVCVAFSGAECKNRIIATSNTTKV